MAQNYIVPDSLIILHDRPVRRPLAIWARDIAHRLQVARSITAPTYEVFEEVSRCFNQAALIQTHAGRLDRAECLCEKQISWVSAIVVKTNQLELAQLVLQPWINLVRLDRLKSDFETAGHRLSELQKAQTLGCISIGPLVLTRQHWAAIRRKNPPITDFVNLVYLVETLKTMLAAQDYLNILHISNNKLSFRTYIAKEFFLEAKLIALCRLGRADEALALGKTCRSNTSFANQPIFELHWAEALAQFENVLKAVDITRQLAVLVDALRVDVTPNVHNLLLAHRVGLLLEQLCLTELAAEIFRTGFTGARRINDEPGQAEFLWGLLRGTKPLCPTRVQWKNSLQTLLENTCYHSLLTKADIAFKKPKPSRMVPVEQLYKSLIQINP